MAFAVSTRPPVRSSLSNISRNCLWPLASAALPGPGFSLMHHGEQLSDETEPCHPAVLPFPASIFQFRNGRQFSCVHGATHLPVLG